MISERGLACRAGDSCLCRRSILVDSQLAHCPSPIGCGPCRPRYRHAGVQPAAALEVGIVAGITLVTLTGLEPLWAMRVADRRFVDMFAQSRLELRDLRRRIETSAPDEYAREFERITAQLGAIEAPSADWAALQAETVSDLMLRLAVIRGQAAADSLGTPEERLQRLERRFEDLIRAKTSFWLLWP